uniref:Cullin domain-containing protein n=1 Tax=Angiostrongylus cantonensis TaxID=6313 RepID=A0A0K0DR11_ANGCA
MIHSQHSPSADCCKERSNIFSCMSMLKKNMSTLISGETVPIIIAHKNTIVLLKELLKNWMCGAEIAQATVVYKLKTLFLNELLMASIDVFDDSKVYANYLNKYETALHALPPPKK